MIISHRITQNLYVEKEVIVEIYILTSKIYGKKFHMFQTISMLPTDIRKIFFQRHNLRHHTCTTVE